MQRVEDGGAGAAPAIGVAPVGATANQSPDGGDGPAAASRLRAGPARAT
jgi:hypothetical protein